MSTSDTTTRGVRIMVSPRYLPERSAPDEERYLFAYDVVIENVGTVPVQLLNRHWIVTNGNGTVQEVRGPGVVGCQPRLVPQESFRYTSGCPLDTPVGTMHGSFQMMLDDNARFDAVIQPFRLERPGTMN
ncbi:MAG TPA: Co2+/Mg2+ efflux protein ApaG [Nevskiaceae bacterium]|nr:Co2+/Mg2+ efflux protein ApaG [Nevskiaceae bacterium]